MDDTLDIFKDDYKRDPVAAASAPSFDPASKPQSLAEMDVRVSTLEDLAIKSLYLYGTASLLELSNRLGLSYSVANDVAHALRGALYCQVVGMNNNIPQISITSQGRARAMELLAQNHYVGVAPVTLEYYTAVTRRQSVANVEVHPEDVQRAFAHLVVAPNTLRQLGATLNSGSSVFIYGPSGVGKTTYAETLSRVLSEEDVWIPHAVEVHGQILAIYDPSTHKKSAKAPDGSHDERWVLCQRPRVMAGGELTIEMLDLQFNPVTKFYISPLQMKANNGVLIIDDFGRQRIRPEELLNRWVVPLDRRIDFLTMSGGAKIEIPFEALVVFASNIDPQDLVDPAFMRRIQTKIYVGAVTKEQFHEIFRRVAKQRNIGYDAHIPQLLIDFIEAHQSEELRACQPGDILKQVTWAAKYERRQPYVDETALYLAISSYFTAKKPR